MDDKTMTVLKEFRPGWVGKYEVQRQFSDWDWRTVSSWDTKAAAYYDAERTAKDTDDATRVVVFD